MTEFFEAAWALRWVVGVAVLIWVLACMIVRWELVLMAFGVMWSGLRAFWVVLKP